ncbi:hypothetical protein BJY01DRAFT_250467 [Aspergillus pseudoustus]|uniref:Uncharacterized protein n=1 Tax=Aspergillus pseudoustus TaxID=1810923 RepID=A0ABR4JHK0_9EURO
MPLSQKERLDLENWRREHHITFIDEIPSDLQPPDYAAAFEAVDKIKQVTYRSYIEHSSGHITPGDAPGKARLKSSAVNLVGNAGDCVARNEETWRLDCEHIMLRRLESDAVCTHCHKSVPESEEALACIGPRWSPAEQEWDLDRCSCLPRARPDDQNRRTRHKRIFIARASDRVLDPDRRAFGIRKGRKPDRVYGLRQTLAFEECLPSVMLNNEPLKHQFSKQPHPPSGEPLLYPFLVVEAKGCKASDDWDSICLQTAFPIYTYLNTQQRLRDATARLGGGSISAPLVWFIMSRGEDWRVYLAYHSPIRPGSTPSSTMQATNVVRVWTGCITTLDGALQLLLIIDYLADWARDLYRPAVLAALNILATPGIKPEPDSATEGTCRSPLPHVPRVARHHPYHHPRKCAYDRLLVLARRKPV